MEIKITEDRENKALNRREIAFAVDQQNGTVSKEDVKKELCKKLSLSPGATIIIRIDQGFGSKSSTGIAHSYASKEQLEKGVPEHVQERLKKAGGKAEPAAPEEKK